MRQIRRGKLDPGLKKKSRYRRVPQTKPKKRKNRALFGGGLQQLWGSRGQQGGNILRSLWEKWVLTFKNLGGAVSLSRKKWGKGIREGGFLGQEKKDTTFYP